MEIMELKNNKKFNKNNEKLFWEVFQNNNLLNKIFEKENQTQLQSTLLLSPTTTTTSSTSSSIEESELSSIPSSPKTIETLKAIKLYSKSITSLESLIKQKLWSTLRDKLMDKQFIHIDKSSLNILFSICKSNNTPTSSSISISEYDSGNGGNFDEDEITESFEIFKLLYENFKLSIKIIDPIQLSIKHNNYTALSVFINYFNLPIYPSNLEYAILNCPLKTIDFLFQSLKNRNLPIDESIKENALINSLLNLRAYITPLQQPSLIKEQIITSPRSTINLKKTTTTTTTTTTTIDYYYNYQLIIYLLNNRKELLSNSIDIIKIPISKCLKIKSIKIKQQLLDFGYLDFSDISPSLENWLIENFRNLNGLEICWAISVLSNSNVLAVDIRDPPNINELIDGIKSNLMSEGYLLSTPIEQQKETLLMLKCRLIQMVRVDRLFIEFLNEFGFLNSIHSLSYCPVQIIYQYTFQSFSIGGLKYLSDNKISILHDLNQILKPNIEVLLDPKNIIEFLRFYFSSENSLNYDGWSEISRFILLNCSVETLNLVLSIPGYPVKTFLIPDLEFDQFSKFQWFIEKIVVPFGFKSSKMSGYSSYFKSSQVSPDYYYNEKDENVRISIKKRSEIDFIVKNKLFFQLSDPNCLPNLMVLNKKMVGGNGFFTLINSIESARYCCSKFPNLPKDLVFYNLIVNTILTCDIDLLKLIDQNDNCKLNYFKGTFKIDGNTIKENEKITNLFKYLNNSGFKSFSKTNGIYYLVLNLIKSFSFKNDCSNDVSYFNENGVHGNNVFKDQDALIISIISNLNQINKFPKCFMDLFIALCFSKIEIDLKLAEIILMKLNFDLFFKIYQFGDLKFKLYKYLIDEYYSVDKRRDESQFEIILSIINILLKKAPTKEEKACFQPLYQHLYNISLSCCIKSLSKVEIIHSIFKEKQIPFKIGFYHSFFYLDIKDQNLGRYYLFIRVDGLENDQFNHSMGYNGEIIPHYSLDSELNFDFILKNSYQDIYYILRTIIMVDPLPLNHNNNSSSTSSNGNGNNQNGNISCNGNGSSSGYKSHQSDFEKLTPFKQLNNFMSTEYSYEDQTFCEEKEQEILFSLNQDIEYLSTFNQYDLIVRLLQDSMEASNIDSSKLKERTISFLISAIDVNSLKKILNLNIKGLDFQLLEHSFYESRLDLIKFILEYRGKSILKSNNVLKNDKHFLFESNHIDIFSFMFEHFFQLMPKFDHSWFDVSFENGLIEMCLLLLKYYPYEKILISKNLLEKTIKNKNINIIKYFYKNFRKSFNFLKVEIQFLIKKYYQLDYKYFKWLN